MKELLEKIRREAEQKIAASENTESLDEVKVSVLGKKGELTMLMKGMKDLSPEERPKFGQLVNQLRSQLETKMNEKRENMRREMLKAKMERETIDVTLPGKKMMRGHKHPNQIALEDLERVFIGMGYEVVDGPEVEYDRMNFRIILQRTSRIHFI